MQNMTTGIIMRSEAKICPVFFTTCCSQRGASFFFFYYMYYSHNKGCRNYHQLHITDTMCCDSSLCFYTWAECLKAQLSLPFFGL